MSKDDTFREVTEGYQTIWSYAIFGGFTEWWRYNMNDIWAD